MYRKQLVSHGITPCRVPSVSGATHRPPQEGERTTSPNSKSNWDEDDDDASARMMALEQQLVKYAKIIREQQMSLSLWQPPFEADLEQLKSELHRKTLSLVKMEEEIAARDLEINRLQASLRLQEATLVERQSENAAKGKEISELQQLLRYKDRCLSWCRNQMASKGLPARLPSEVEILYDNTDGQEEHQLAGSTSVAAHGHASTAGNSSLSGKRADHLQHVMTPGGGDAGGDGAPARAHSVTTRVEQWSREASKFPTVTVPGSSISFAAQTATVARGDDAASSGQSQWSAAGTGAGDGRQGKHALGAESSHIKAHADSLDGPSAADSSSAKARAIEPSPKKSTPLPPPATKSARIDGQPIYSWNATHVDDDDAESVPPHSVRTISGDEGMLTVMKSDHHLQESGGSTPASSAHRRNKGGGGGSALPSGDWDTAKAEVREQMRQLKVHPFQCHAHTRAFWQPSSAR